MFIIEYSRKAKKDKLEQEKIPINKRRIENIL